MKKSLLKVKTIKTISLTGVMASTVKKSITPSRSVKKSLSQRPKLYGPKKTRGSLSLNKNTDEIGLLSVN